MEQQATRTARRESRGMWSSIGLVENDTQVLRSLVQVLGGRVPAEEYRHRRPNDHVDDDRASDVVVEANAIGTRTHLAVAFRAVDHLLLDWIPGDNHPLVSSQEGMLCGNLRIEPSDLRS